MCHVAPSSLPDRENPKRRAGSLRVNPLTRIVVSSLMVVVGCNRSTGSPAASVTPSPLAVVPAPGRLRAAVPLGDAMLQVWGYTFGNAPGALCQILRAPLLGSVVTTRVRVEPYGEGWLARSLPGNGDLQLRFSQTGQVTLTGLPLAGEAAGRALNTIWIDDAGPRDRLSLQIAPDGGQSIAQGLASDTVRFVTGTLTGPAFFEDPDGPIVSCSYLYWTLQPVPPV